jgi:hypothetical protein
MKSHSYTKQLYYYNRNEGRGNADICYEYNEKEAAASAIFQSLLQQPPRYWNSSS